MDIVKHPYWLLIPIVVVGLIAWQFGSNAGYIDITQWSSPARIAATLTHDFVAGDGSPATHNSQPLYYHVGRTLKRFVLGFLIASTSGVAIGFALGMSRLVYGIGQPVVNFLRALPSSAVWPICALITGFNEKAQLIVICFGATWPVLINTMDSVRGLPVEVFDSLSFMRIGRIRTWLALCCWSAPGIYTGLEIGCGVAFLLTVTMEIIWQNNGGLGWYLIYHTQNIPDPERLFGGVFIVALLGWSINTVFRKLRRRLLFWETADLAVDEKMRTENARSLLRRIRDPDIARMLTTDTVTETIQEAFKSRANPKVLYQGPKYMLPRDAARYLKVTGDEKYLVQRDVVIPVDANDPTSRVLLFARSWIRIDLMSEPTKAKLAERHETIGTIVRKYESARRCTYRNLWYREQISDKLGIAFGVRGPIHAIQRARLILLDEQATILIHEFVRV